MNKADFILLADNPILDFVNTRIKHADHEIDFISDSRQAEDFFKVVFDSKVKIDKKSLVQLKKNRQSLKLFFHQLIQKSKKRESTIQTLPWFDISSPPYSIEVRKTKSQDKFDITIQPSSNQRHLAVISKGLIDFLTIANPSRIKKCKSKTCSHLFYDKSKPNTRVWCSMRSCGNLAKIRKFRSLK